MSHFRGLATAGMLLALTGCGPSGPDISSVTGTVTMDGKPLPNASVVFQPEKGRPSGALTNENGEFELNFSGGRKGAQPGRYIVAIRTASDGSIDDDGQRTPGTPETVPAKYNAASELIYTVEEGVPNVAEFKLKSDGELPTEADGDDN